MIRLLDTLSRRFGWRRFRQPHLSRINGRLDHYRRIP